MLVIAYLYCSLRRGVGVRVAVKYNKRDNSIQETTNPKVVSTHHLRRCRRHYNLHLCCSIMYPVILYISRKSCNEDEDEDEDEDKVLYVLVQSAFFFPT